MPHLRTEHGENTVSGRGIYDGRDESLADGGHRRLHLICGESLCSQLANYLKLGTTALVVALIEAGRCDGDALAFCRSVQAMRRFSSDPSLGSRCAGRDGRRRSALEVQRAYLEMAEAELGSGLLPDWAPELCRRWREVLDALERDPGALATRLDWSIKLALFRDRLERAGLRWQDLEPGRGLGAELCEIDTRFGELGGAGLFDALDRAGALDHALDELGPVEEAVAAPPPGGRAEARGRAIAALAGRSDRYQANWDLVFDHQTGRFLDLGDPFVREPVWKAARRPARPGTRLQRHLAHLIGRGQAAYCDMSAERAVRVLEHAVALAAARVDLEREALARFWCAGALNDLARLEEAERVLGPSLRTPAIRPSTRCRLVSRLAVVRVESAADEAAELEAMALLREARLELPNGEGRSRESLLEGRRLMRRGRWADAISVLERALGEAGSDSLAFALPSYFRWLVEAAFGAGDLRCAREAIARWRPIADSSYRAITLACAESELARREGRTGEALVRAEVALSRARPFPRHRCMLEAGLAVYEAASGAGQADRARALRRSLRRWRQVEILALRERVVAVLAGGASAA